jgi:threonine/homoserine/homoserine lactone efflux protein
MGRDTGSPVPDMNDLHALLAASEFLFQVIKWAGVAFLGLRLLGSEGVVPLLPQFVVVEMPWPPQYLVLGAVFGVVDFLVMLGYAFLGRQASRMCSPRGVPWLERLCGGVFFILSASLALYRRQG